MRRGARLCDKRSAERNTNREGVAAGGATKNFKKSLIFTKAPSHEKHFATLDVRGLWHARPLPTTSAIDKSRPAAAHNVTCYLFLSIRINYSIKLLHQILFFIKEFQHFSLILIDCPCLQKFFEIQCILIKISWINQHWN